nr:hypothetical protein [Tanacetum cinerariifolium]
KKVDEDPRKESNCNDHEKEDNVNNTNNVNTAGNVNIVSATINVVDTNEVNVVGGKISIELLFDPKMSALEDDSIFDFSSDDEDEGAVANINSLDTTIQVSPIPTTRIHKDHPLDQVIRDLQSATQTRKMSKNLEEHGAIGSKWVFMNKKDERGIVIRNKVKLVAQGHTQEEGIDNDKFFAPVARIKEIRLFLAYASFKDFMVYQMDVKSVFLYGKIKEEVYVCQPLGFEDPDFPDRVYKVEKALYGLHQAPKAWYETLLTYLLDNGFQRGKINKTLFIKRHKVKQKKDGIFISQDNYVAEILKKFKFIEVKTVSTSMETQKPLLKDKDGEEVNVHMYRSMIGSLMYLTSSRPDIMFAVCACARYQVNLKVSHLHAVKRIFRYFKGKSKKRVRLIMEKVFGMELEFMLVTQKSDGFEQIVDFLNAYPIRYALTINPTIYISFIEQFWSTTMAKTINVKAQLHALVDGKEIIITESSVRRDLRLESSAILTNLHHTPTIIQPQKKQQPKKPKRKDTHVPQPSDPIENVLYEAVHKELGNSLVRAATTASSLEAEQDNGNINKTQSKATPNESSSQGPNLGNTLQSDVDSLKIDELMALCTTLQNRVLDLEKTMTTQRNEIASLKMRVKKLEKKNRSRTHKLKRLYKVSLMARVESLGNEESLGEDASKQERIDAIDADEEIKIHTQKPGRQIVTIHRDDWDHLFQPMFGEYFNPPTRVVSPVLIAAAPRAVDLADSLVSMIIEQDSSSSSIPSIQEQEHSLSIS